MASPIIADFGDHKNVKKNIVQLNSKRNQPVHMDFMIYWHNLGDRESEKPKIPMCTSWFLQTITVKVGSILRIFVFWARLK